MFLDNTIKTWSLNNQCQGLSWIVMCLIYTSDVMNIFSEDAGSVNWHLGNCCWRQLVHWPGLQQSMMTVIWFKIERVIPTQDTGSSGFLKSSGSTVLRQWCNVNCCVDVQSCSSIRSCVWRQWWKEACGDWLVVEDHTWHPKRWRWWRRNCRTSQQDGERVCVARVLVLAAWCDWEFSLEDI